jgi:ketosteroid isomerase-like protein
MLQAFNDGDIEAIVADCDPAVEWEEQSIPGVEPVSRGHDGVRRWAAAVLGLREELGPLEGRLEGVKETDDMVIASVRFEGEGSCGSRRKRLRGGAYPVPSGCGLGDRTR